MAAEILNIVDGTNKKILVPSGTNCELKKLELVVFPDGVVFADGVCPQADEDGQYRGAFRSYLGLDGDHFMMVTFSDPPFILRHK